MAHSETETGALTWRDLSIADLEAIYGLHIQAIEKVGRPELIRPETLEFFTRMVTDAGRMIGAFDDEGLLAYGVLQWDLSIEEDPFGPLRIDRATRLVKLAGSSVRPSYWGHGLHSQLISLRIDAALALGFTQAYSTSAPGNHRSWTNLIGEGFRVRTLKEQYGGHLRFLLLKDIGETLPFEPQQWCPIEDIELQRGLIDGGCEGVDWRHRGDSHEILYGRRMQVG